MGVLPVPELNDMVTHVALMVLMKKGKFMDKPHLNAQASTTIVKRVENLSRLGKAREQNKIKNDFIKFYDVTIK